MHSILLADQLALRLAVEEADPVSALALRAAELLAQGLTGPAAIISAAARAQSAHDAAMPPAWRKAAEAYRHAD
jgi:hypothetical protein